MSTSKSARGPGRQGPGEPAGPFDPWPIAVAMVSRLGGRARNEDACGYLAGKGPACFVIADGAGGHGCGDVAARTAVRAVLDAFADQPGASPRTVMAALQAAQIAVRSAQQDNPACADMRSTLVVLILGSQHDQASWGHIGDSRLYAFREGRIMHQTRDHSLYESMIAAGLATEQDRRGNPARNMLFASLGGDEGFEPDVLAEAQRICAGDAFLLCTDGLWDGLDDAAMLQALQGSADAAGWLESLEQALLRTPRRGRDNYSAIALRVSDIGEATRIDAA